METITAIDKENDSRHSGRGTAAQSDRIPAQAIGRSTAAKLGRIFDEAKKARESAGAGGEDGGPRSDPVPLPTQAQVRAALAPGNRVRLDPEAVLAYTLAPSYFAMAVGFEPEPWQIDMLDSMKTRVGVLAARQSGKSLTIAYKKACYALCHPATTGLIISPTMRQSSELLLKVAGVFARAGLRVAQQSQFSIMLADKQPGAHSRVIALPGSAEDAGASVRGYTADNLCLEEAAFLDEIVIQTVLPSIAAGPKAQLLAISSAGLVGTWFHSVMTADDKTWERHVIEAENSGRFVPEQLEELRKTLGARYDQEMRCAWGTQGDGIFDAEAFAGAFGTLNDALTPREDPTEMPFAHLDLDAIFTSYVPPMGR